MNKITLYGAKWSHDTTRIKRLLDQHDVEYKYYDIKNKKHEKKVRELNPDNKAHIPLIIINNKKLINPTNTELLKQLNLENKKEEIYDCAIIGAGPAGMTAGMYMSIYKQKTIILEKNVPGGQLSTTQWVINYPGFPNGISGLKLSDKMREQVKKFGVELKYPTTVKKIKKTGKTFHLETTQGKIKTRSIIICTGSHYKKLKVKGEKKYIGKGVSYCAACDAVFAKNKTIIIAGGGNSAVEEAYHLSKYAERIIIINKAKKLTASPALIDNLEKRKNVEVWNNSEIKNIQGNKTVEKVTIIKEGVRTEVKAQMVFVFIGLIPSTEFLKGFVKLNKKGFIKVNKNYETNVKGVFAAGDCTEHKISQATISIGQATIAAYNCYHYLQK